MPTTLQAVVIADDLTGALDAVAPFAAAGLRCVVATAPIHLQAALDQSATVVAVSTNSREMAETQAAQVMHAVAQALPSVPFLFKKIDSRLKGHIAAEVAALAQAKAFDSAVICPAIPQMGRIVRDGCLLGSGIAAPLAVESVLAGLGLTVTAPDALTDADIDRMMATVSTRTLLVGARGLSAGLARLLAQQLARKAPKPISLPLPGPVIFVVGSRDPITLAQVAHLRQSHLLAVHVGAPNGWAANSARPSDLMILQATPGTPAADPAAVTRALAHSLLGQITPLPASLVLTGGETAAAVLAQMGLGLLEVLAEVLPGLPLCRPLGHGAAPLIVTKSGGFGDAQTLSLLVDPHPFTARQPREPA